MICSDATEHRDQIETCEVNIAGMVLSIWARVIARLRTAVVGSILVDAAGEIFAETRLKALRLVQGHRD